MTASTDDDIRWAYFAPFNLDGCQAAIATLRGLDQRTVLEGSVIPLIGSLISSWNIPSYVIADDAKNVRRWFRGRVLDKEQVFTSIVDLRYPPAASTKRGRANVENSPVFYASGTIGTVLAELDAVPGSRVQILEVAPRAGSLAKFGLLGELEYLYRSGKRVSFYGLPSFSSYFLEQSHHLAGDAGHRALLIDAFLAERFRLRSERKGLSEYLISSVAAWCLLNEGIDGILYPSVEHHGGTNIFTKAASFDQKFDVLKTQIIKPTKFLGFGIYEWVVERESTQYVDGAFHW